MFDASSSAGYCVAHHTEVDGQRMAIWPGNGHLAREWPYGQGMAVWPENGRAMRSARNIYSLEQNTAITKLFSAHALPP